MNRLIGLNLDSHRLNDLTAVQYDIMAEPCIYKFTTLAKQNISCLLTWGGNAAKTNPFLCGIFVRAKSEADILGERQPNQLPQKVGAFLK